MANIMKALGEGLRIAGASNSDANFQMYNRQNEFATQREDEKQKLVLGLLIKGIENGMPGAAEALEKWKQKNEGYADIPNIGLSPEVQKMRAEEEKQKRIIAGRGKLIDEYEDLKRSVAGEFDLDYQGVSPIKSTNPNIAMSSTKTEDGVEISNISSKGDLVTPDIDLTAKNAAETDVSWNEELALRLQAKANEAYGGMDKEMGDRLSEIAKFHKERAESLAAGEAAVKGGDKGKPSAKEEQIARLKSIGATDEQAIKVADGVYVVATDSQGRDYVWDKLKGKRVSDMEPIATTIKESGSAEGPNVDVEAATGGSGFLKRSGNTLVGLFGGGLVFEDAETATDALEQLRVSTIGIGEAQIPGRPSNFQLELVDKLTINPRNILTGDAKALNKLKSTRSWLEREYDRMYDVVLSKPRQYSNKEIAETNNNASQMRVIINQYNWMIDQMERKGKPRKSASEIWNEE